MNAQQLVARLKTDCALVYSTLELVSLDDPLIVVQQISASVFEAARQIKDSKIVKITLSNLHIDSDVEIHWYWVTLDNTKVQALVNTREVIPH